MLLIESSKILRSVDEVVELIKANVGGQTKAYEFFEVLNVEPFQRPESSVGVPCSGILKIHSFTKTADGRILARKLTCKSCLEQEDVCPECNQNARVVYKPELVTLEEGPQEGPEDDAGAHEEEEEDEVEDGGVDMLDETDSCLGEDEDAPSASVLDEVMNEIAGSNGIAGDGGDKGRLQEFGGGCCVWVRKRQWLPGHIVDHDEAPAWHASAMQGNAGEHFVVALFPPFSDVVVVHTHQMAALGENECDRKLKRKSPEISEAYDNALAFLHNEG